jgi:plasmid stability protein
MATLTLKNVPDSLYARLKLAAARNRRSLNQEAIAQLEQCQLDSRPDPEVLAQHLREFRASLGTHYTIRDEDIDAWKRAGRL